VLVKSESLPDWFSSTDQKTTDPNKISQVTSSLEACDLEEEKKCITPSKTAFYNNS